MAATVTNKGQVTIPKAVRTRLGISPGDPVTFDLTEDGRVVMAKAPPEEPVSRFRKLLGSAGPGPSTDEIMLMLRGAPEE